MTYCAEKDTCMGCPLDDCNDVFCEFDPSSQYPDSDAAIEIAYNIIFPNASPPKDSGNRRKFDTGAVRDIQDGKGRCDLMPLDIVSDYLEANVMEHRAIKQISMFQQSGDTKHLHLALDAFLLDHAWTTPDMLLEVAKHFEDGAKKYGENNWQKGIPLHCYIDSAVRHYLKWLREDEDEPHDRAFCWNIMCAIWTCAHKPELNDYARKDD